MIFVYGKLESRHGCSMLYERRKVNENHKKIIAFSCRRFYFDFL